MSQQKLLYSLYCYCQQISDFALCKRYPNDPTERAKIDAILDWHHNNLRHGACMFLYIFLFYVLRKLFCFLLYYIFNRLFFFYFFSKKNKRKRKRKQNLYVARHDADLLVWLVPVIDCNGLFQHQLRVFKQINFLTHQLALCRYMVLVPADLNTKLQKSSLLTYQPQLYQYDMITFCKTNQCWYFTFMVAGLKFFCCNLSVFCFF